MAVIRISTTIAAPIERCFDLARDIDFHIESFAPTGERAIAGRTTGLIELGESVTWKGRHLGVRQRFTSKITAFAPPTYFRDVMTAGAFHAFAHDHHFAEENGNTVMTDEVVFQSPLGLLGKVVDYLFMEQYMRRLLQGRGQFIKRRAESDGHCGLTNRSTCGPAKKGV